jgi:hypothetical protein
MIRSWTNQWFQMDSKFKWKWWICGKWTIVRRCESMVVCARQVYLSPVLFLLLLYFFTAMRWETFLFHILPPCYFASPQPSNSGGQPTERWNFKLSSRINLSSSKLLRSDIYYSEEILANISVKDQCWKTTRRQLCQKMLGLLISCSEGNDNIGIRNVSKR